MSRSWQIVLSWRSLFGQPLPYFLLAGCAIFAADRLFRTQDTTIVLTAAVRSELASQVAVQLGHEPHPDELQRALERWQEEQALFREGIKLGLMDNDPVIQSHIAAKLRFVAAEGQVIPEPSEAELRSYYETHLEAFRQPVLVNLDHVFISAAPTPTQPPDLRSIDVRASDALALLQNGAAPNTVGDHFPRGPTFSNSSANDLLQALGVDVSPLLKSPLIGQWQMLSGRRGLHLVRLTRVGGGLPPFDEVRPKVRSDVQAENKDRLSREYVEQVTARYHFRSEP